MLQPLRLNHTQGFSNCAKASDVWGERRFVLRQPLHVDPQVKIKAGLETSIIRCSARWEKLMKARPGGAIKHFCDAVHTTSIPH